MSSPVPKPLARKPKNPKLRGLGLTLKCCRPPTTTTTHFITFKHEGLRQRLRTSQNGPLYISTQNMSGSQQEEGCRVFYLVQREHHQSYLWHHHQNESIQDRQIYSVQDGTKCRSTISHGGTVPHYSLVSWVNILPINCQAQGPLSRPG